MISRRHADADAAVDTPMLLMPTAAFSRRLFCHFVMFRRYAFCHVSLIAAMMLALFYICAICRVSCRILSLHAMFCHAFARLLLMPRHALRRCVCLICRVTLCCLPPRDATMLPCAC